MRTLPYLFTLFTFWAPHTHVKGRSNEYPSDLLPCHSFMFLLYFYRSYLQDVDLTCLFQSICRAVGGWATVGRLSRSVFQWNWFIQSCHCFLELCVLKWYFSLVWATNSERGKPWGDCYSVMGTVTIVRFTFNSSTRIIEFPDFSVNSQPIFMKFYTHYFPYMTTLIISRSFDK